MQIIINSHSRTSEENSTVSLSIKKNSVSPKNISEHLDQIIIFLSEE